MKEIVLTYLGLMDGIDVDFSSLLFDGHLDDVLLDNAIFLGTIGV